MTRYEYIKNIGLDKLAHYLCDQMDNVEVDGRYGCEICPVEELCFIGSRNGFVEWLKQEMTTDDAEE